MIRLLLVDDQPPRCDALRALLEAEDDIEVVGQAADSQGALSLVRAHLPDIVLIDIQLPNMDGIEAIRRIAEDPALSRVPVVILTDGRFDDYASRALRAGAAGFIVKNIEPEDFVHAVRVTAHGDALFASAITPDPSERHTAQPPHTETDTEPARLTRREREVVTLVAQGLCIEEIAERMVISPRTAKAHLSQAMAKLHARDRAQLVALAYESGLVAPPGR